VTIPGTPPRLATIDLSAIEANVARLRAIAAPASVMAVVKADGYGHGAVPVARAALAGGASWLGVADLREAIELRDAGIEAPVLAWLHDSDADFGEAVRRAVEVGVSDLAQLEAVARAGVAIGGGGETAPAVQLKVDTGLGRNGAPEASWPALFTRAAELERSGAVRVTGVFSHLSNTDDDEDLAQRDAYLRALALAAAAGLDPEWRHLAATAGALRLPDTRFSLVRTGIGVYGLTPFDEGGSAELGLRPALTLESRVSAVDRGRALATIPLGFADGIPSHAADRASVWIAGRRAPVVGAIGVDSFDVDVAALDVTAGDRVVLFGDPASGYPASGYPSVDDWARACGTINYEIVARLGPRIERRYLP
jgi:alanine racemase